jgi:hypothetical protein
MGSYWLPVPNVKCLLDGHVFQSVQSNQQECQCVACGMSEILLNGACTDVCCGFPI